MIRMIPSKSPEQAKAYFTDALTQADYYLNDQELQGHLKGRLAERLQVTGVATKGIFFALADNKHPGTRKPLTPRMKEKRIVGYDINFHCPKSVSILHALSQDDHIIKAFQESVNETMLDIEKDSKTRVRKGGVFDDRDTGELIWAEFTHQTARPVDEHVPDPHLHSHCFVFNATWDDAEKKIKAGKFRDIMRDMPYYKSRFQKRLADKLVRLGYLVRKTEKAFEMDGVPHEVIRHFSKRTNEIGRVAKEKGITNRDDLDALGAKTRSKKQKGLTMAQLRDEWRKQIKDIHHDKEDLETPVRFSREIEKDFLKEANCINHSLTHNFERASVMTERQLLKTAYEFALGSDNLSLDAIENEMAGDDKIIRINQGGRILCTTKEVLAEERRMIELAKQGQNRMSPLTEIPRILDRSLNNQQKAAITHIMTTRHRVAIVRGAAGTGKTTMLKCLDKLMQEKGNDITFLAPTAQASRMTLREEGFKDAETVAKFLVDKKLQEKIKHKALLVDESGLLGIKDMVRLLEVATMQKARLILVGDTRQHASVVRGDALRILNTIGGIPTAEMSEIRRQRNVHYKAAVEDLSKGNIADGFNKLDAMGAIKTIDRKAASNPLVEEYIATLKKGKKALVISPTHAQGDAITEEIRKNMRDKKMLGKKEITLTRLANLNMTEAEKGDWRNYEAGQVIQFNQNLSGVKRGSRWTISKQRGSQIEMENDEGRKIMLPRFQPKTFDVYKQSTIALSKGDKIRITKTGFDNSMQQKRESSKPKKRKRRNLKKTNKNTGKKMENGTILEVMAVSTRGKIKLLNKTSKTSYILRRDFAHIAYAHCITSYAAQGKTVDEVFISQPADTFGATDAKQFYVSVSRGRNMAHIYTDDREALLEAASEMGERQSALELVKVRDKHLEHVLQRQIIEPQIQRPKEKSFIPKQNRQPIEKDYELGI